MTAAGPGTRGRPVRLVALVAVLLVSAVLVLAVTSRDADPPSGPTGRSVVETVLADEPDAPVVLPVTLPPGYVLAGGDTAGGAAGDVPVAAWVFNPVQASSGLAVVQLCVAPAARCVASPDGVLAREVDGRDVSVLPLGLDADVERTLELWSDAELTSRWQSLEWIDEPLER